MRRRIPALLIIGVLVLGSAQAKEPAQKGTTCEVNSRPGKYNGKIVSLRGRVVQGFEWFYLKSGDCSLHLAYPDEPSDLGPSATYQEFAEPKPRARFKVIRDENYKRLVEYANVPGPMPEGCICIACYRYQVTATITGMFEVAKRGRPGFGHMNEARARLVILSVSDVVPVDKLESYQKVPCGPPRLELPPVPPSLLETPSRIPPFGPAPPKQE